MKPRNVRRAIRIAVLFVLLCCGIAAARPGGGHSSSSSRSSSSSSRSSSSSHSSGGGFHSSGGGGSIGGEGILIIIVLFVVVAIIYGVAQSAQRANRDSWQSAQLLSNTDYIPPPQPRPLDLSPLYARDPEFSLSAFEDFVFELYAAAQRSRSDAAKLGALSAYLDSKVISQLASRGPAPVQIVVGSLRVTSLGQSRNDANIERLEVKIEATLHTQSPKYAVEIWTFDRQKGVVSKPPARNRTWPCPNCGAAWAANANRTCSYCNEPMGSGRFDWVCSWTRVESSVAALASLTGTVEEYGNDLPTVRAADVDQQMAKLSADDPAIDAQALSNRTSLIYQRLNTAWNTDDLKKVRGLVTASLRNYLAYWLDEYRRQGLSNHLDNAAIQTVQLSKITRDKHYDAVTLRVFAGGNDYTLGKGGKVVGGSKSQNRRYTEYWTLLRSSAARGAVTLEPKCAKCGAPLEDASDQGDCTHCGATNELGSFDWVLSKIEQDDNYVG